VRPSVPIGPTTVAGWGTAAVAFVLAAIAYLTGGHTAEQTTAVELAGAGVLSGLVTQIGRYLQAHKEIDAEVQVELHHGVLGGARAREVEEVVERKMSAVLPPALVDVAEAMQRAKREKPST
jgi:hypothetical protein